MAEDVKVFDAGGTLVLSGDTSAAIESALGGFVRRGAKIVTPVSLVGRNWVAACTEPPKSSSLDTTQTLHLSDLAGAIAASRPEDPNDGCRIEEFGLKRIVYGPSRQMVQLRVAHLKQFGAELVGEIEEENGEWVAVCDAGGEQNVSYRS